MIEYDGIEIFKNRPAVIATMHEKEKVIAPLLEAKFNMKCLVPKGLNTDQFGTFSGEIERIKNPLETARAKAFAALSICNETLAISSEGSFGPHPESPFITGNQELVVLIDIVNNIEIIGRHFTEKTNFYHQKIQSLKDLKDFAQRIGFPEHGIILKSSNKKNSKSIFKDFRNSDSLQNEALNLMNDGRTIIAETDMRAMYNPTRMLAIELATKNLVDTINSLCPKCNAPGFSIIEALRGLRCRLCNLPTKGVKSYIYSCQKCNFNDKREKEGVDFQDPTFCDFCNP